MYLSITLNDQDAILRLTEEANKVDRPIHVATDDGMVMVDARSILALFSLIGKPCNLVAGDGFDPKLLEKVAKQAEVL